MNTPIVQYTNTTQVHSTNKLIVQATEKTIYFITTLSSHETA